MIYNLKMKITRKEVGEIMLTNFKKEQEKITQAYKKLIEYKFVPLKRRKITEKDIEESIKELQEARFIVSFCGQIKAGKSTLLNALLFGDEILPAASTPHTAKITIINYAKEPYFEVIYYTEKEWEDLKQKLKEEKIEEDGEKTTYFDKYLKPQIANSIKHGVFEKQVIGKPKETIKDLSKLDDYVGAEGKFTPFVKEIHLYWPNEILKQVTIVDTPGTNDPNPYRSKITEDWIHKSNAVVYVVYAGQAFSTADIDFIDKYLVGIDPALLVFAVNKMDMVNKSELEAWINKVREDETLKARGIMQDEDSVVYVSGLGGLIRKLADSGKLASSQYIQDKEFLMRLDSSGWIANPGLENLEKVIEKKIIKSKGEKIIESHKAKIRGILIDKILELKSEITVLSQTLETAGKKKFEIQKQIEENKKKLKRINLDRDKFVDNIAKMLSKFQGDLKDYLDDLRIKTLRSISNEIYKISSLDLINKNTKPLVSRILHKTSNDLIRDLIGRESSPIGKLASELQDSLLEYEKAYRGGSENLYIASGLFKTTYDKLVENLKESEPIISKKVLEVVNSIPNLGFWEKLAFWNRESQVKEKKKALITALENIISEHYFDSIFEITVSITNNSISTSIANELFVIFESEISTTTKNLEKLKNSLTSTQDKEKEIKAKLISAEQNLKRYKELACQIMDIMEESCNEISVFKEN